jgi:hypothetical protein
MTNLKKFPGKKADEMPKELEHTEAYIMSEVLFCSSPTKTVPDLESGQSARNRRWGCSVMLAVIPELDKVPPNEAPLLLPKSPSKFFAADSLEDLRARVIFELDKSIEMAKMSVEDPEQFIKLQQEMMLEHQKMFSREEGVVPRDPEDDMN